MVKQLHEPVLDRLLEVVVLLNADATESLGRLGLSVPRATLAWRLHHEGPLTQRALADALRVTPRNVTGLVDGLVETGFVTREPHPTDRRATLVSLTAHGTGVMEEMARQHAELAELLFGGMEELPAFARGLEQVLAKLQAAPA